MKKLLLINMKKLLLILLIAPLFFACGSDDDNKDGDGLEIQDYTSFVIENEYPKNNDLYYMIIGIQGEDKTWHKIADIGTLISGEKSQDIKLIKYYRKVRVFCKLYIDTGTHYYLDFELKENRKNILSIEGDIQWTDIKDLTDPKQYPQE